MSGRRAVLAALAAASFAASSCSSSRPVAPGTDPTATLAGAPVRSTIDGLAEASFLTSHTVNELLPAPSPDGTRMLFVSERDAQKDLYIKPLGEGVGRGSIQVTFHAADDTDPSWSPDGERIAFSSQREDPDGDLYVVRLPPVPGLAELIGERTVWQRAGVLTRLTDGLTADRQPAWSPDGERVVYASRWKNESAENLWILDPAKPAWRWRMTWAGGHDPAWTPDGEWVIYAVARGEDPADTDLWAMRPSDCAERQLTSGGALDSSPSVSADGQHVVFTRFAEDTNGDGRVTLDDDPSIQRLDLDTRTLAALDADHLPAPIPLTPSDAFDAFPRIVGSRVVMASDRLAVRGKSLDIVEMPLEGLVREEPTRVAQMALARALDGHTALDARVRLFAYQKVLRPFGSAASAGDGRDGASSAAPSEPDARAILDEARERIGELYLEAGQRTDAVRAFETLVAEAEPTSIARARAEIELARIRRAAAEDDLSAPAQRRDLERELDAGLAALADIGARFAAEPEITVRVATERGRHQLARGDRGAALDAFREAESAAGAFPRLAAEAAFERGRVYESVSDAQGVVGSDVNLLTRYHGVAPWSARAAERAIAAVLGDATVLDPPERLARLAALADQHKSVPVLPARALLEIGKANAEQGRPERAEEVYRRIPSEFADDEDEVAEARFRLASLAYAAGRWDEALEQYRAIQREVEPSDKVYELAREAFIRSAIEKGNRELEGRDPQSAIATFVGLIKYDASVVEAHRGLVQAYENTHRVAEILAHYRDVTARAPADGVAAYALGLAHTYESTPDFDAAEKWLRRSIVLEPRNAYAHQTLGFVLEARAAQTGEPGVTRQLVDATVGAALGKVGIATGDDRGRTELLNQALERYQAAAALSDETLSPGQRADLDGNLGNVYLKLGNDLRAFEAYQSREASGRPFAVPETEAIFHGNFAKAAEATGHLADAEKQALAALAFWRKKDDLARIYELTDTLGLVYQQLGRHDEAVEAYREALELSRRRGDTANAFRALQNLAVNLTFSAEQSGGRGNWELLDEALARHEEGLTKLGGDTGSSSASGFAVTNVNVALAGESSTAATGFDEAGLRRLFLSFIARIHRDAGNLDEAIAALEAKRATLAELDVDDAKQNPGLATDHAVLNEQLGALRLDQGNAAAALEPLERSLALNLALENVGAMGALDTLEQLARLAGEAPPSVLGDARLARLVTEAGTVRGLTGGAAAASGDRRVLVARAWNAEAELIRVQVARESASGAAPGGSLAERVRRALDAASQDAAALDPARAALDGGIKALGAPADADANPVRRTRAILAINRARLGLRTPADAKAVRAALDATIEDLGEVANDDLRWRAFAERGALRERSLDDDEGAAADLGAAGVIAKSLPPGAMEALDADELEALFGRLARRALAAGKTSRALLLLDTARAVELEQTVGAGLTAGAGATSAAAPVDASTALEAAGGAPATTASPAIAADPLARYRAAIGGWRALQEKNAPPAADEARRLWQDANAALDELGQASPALASVLTHEPLEPGDLQARLAKGEVVLVPTRLPGRAGTVVFRLDAEKLDVVSVAADATPEALTATALGGAAKPIALYGSPRGALARGAGLGVAAPAGVPAARVASLAHLAAALDARNVLREGQLRIARAASSKPDASIAEVAGPTADRERIVRALEGKPIVEIATPIEGGADPLGLRPALPLDPGSVRRFTVEDLIDAPARRRVLLAESLELPALTRDAALQLFAAAGFPSVVVAPDPAVRAAVVAALGEASVGEAVASARKKSPDAVIELHGAVGFDADQAIAFAEERYGEQVSWGVRAYEERRWKDAADAFAEALSLEAVLDRPADRAQLLFRLTDACARSEQWQRAAHFQEQAVTDARKHGDGAALASALFDLGVFRSREEDWDGALAALGESAELWGKLGRVADKSQALATQGIAEEGAGRYERALGYFDTALGLEETSGSAEGQGRQIRRIGRIQLVRLNRYGDAEASFRKAQELLDEAGDIPGWIEATLEIGLARVAVGDLTGAVKQYKEGLEAAQDSDEPALVAKALVYRAEAEWLGANYGDAFNDLRAATEAAEKASASRQVFMAKNLNALVKWSLNDFDAALDEANQALAIAEKLGEKADVSAVRNNLGIIHRDAGRPTQALEELAEAMRVDRAIGSRWGEGYDLRNIGMTYLKMERLDAAQETLAKAVEVSRSIGDRVNEAKALVSLGDTQLALRQTSLAEKTFTDTAALARELGVREVEWRALWGQGRAARDVGRLDDARTSLEAAVELVESMRASLKIEEMRNGFITNKVDLYEDLIRLLLDRGETARAFDVAERSRARGFIDLLGNQKLTPAKAASRELLDRVRALDVRTEALRSQPAGAERDSAIAAAASERRDLLTQIQLADPALSSFVSVAPLDLAGVQKLLTKDTVLVAYFVARGEVIAWVVRPDGIDVARTPMLRRELEKEVLAFRDRIQKVEPVENDSQALYDVLMRPVAARIPADATLAIVPHGVLHYLSFAALADAKAAGKPYLIESHPLFYSASASVLGYTIKPDAARPRGNALKVLAIGNPDLGARDFDLPFAEKEVKSLAWTYPQIDILTGPKATKEWLLAHVGDYDVIHLASHGEFDPVNPLASALKLSTTSADHAAGDLFAREVFGLDLEATMVTLSACQTGLGKVEAGDEVIGLSRAFLYAGTQSLLSSLWRVSDVSTAVLVKHFYRNFVHEPRAESLRQAQLHVMSYYPHPTYWAGFVLSGDYR